MQKEDLDDVLAVAAAVHPGFPERREVFAERLALFPSGCHVLSADGTDQTLLGYAVSHPWHAGRPVPLDHLIMQMPDDGCRYIHDVAILPAVRSGGQAGRIVGRIVRDAYRAGAPCVSLVAVSGSQPFWERHGFRAIQIPGLAAKLESYGADARFMVRDLAR